MNSTGRTLERLWRHARYLQVQLHEVGLPPGQRRLEDAVVLPQRRAGLREARQPPPLVLQFQSQLLTRLLEVLYLPPEASGLLELQRPVR